MSLHTVSDRAAADALRGEGADHLSWFVGQDVIREFTPRRLIEHPTPTPATWQAMTRTYSRDDAIALMQAVRAVFAEHADREVPRDTPGARPYTIIFSISPDPP